MFVRASFLAVLFLSLPVVPFSAETFGSESALRNYGSLRDDCVRYFDEIFSIMDDNYHFSADRVDLNRFMVSFDEKIFPSLIAEQKSDDYVRWRSAAYLVDFLKQPDDIFSRFLPPKPAEEFAKEVYGQKIDLGIDGRLDTEGFVVTFVEPRSEAFALGLRENDLIIQIASVSVLSMDEKRVKEALLPLEGAKVRIDYIDSVQRQLHSIEPESKEYYKQTVFQKPTGVKDVFCLEIQKFNRMTNEDMGRYLGVIAAQSPKGLVIDLRNNPGGPPLAALLISSFFLPNDELFAYFEGRHKPRSDLLIPRIPDQFHYDWPLVVLVNQGTGSASELFSGILQDYKRAVILGYDTAGQVLLKSMFDLSDGSTLALLVARGHFSDGRPFPFDGVKPNEYLLDDMGEDLVIKNAAHYLMMKNSQQL